MRQTTSIIAIGLVGGERLERLVGLPALDGIIGETKLVQPAKQVIGCRIRPVLTTS